MDYAIWLLAFGLYVFDSAKLLQATQLLLVETGGRGLAPAISDAPFTLGGRVVEFCPLLLPYRGVFVTSWGGPWTEPDRLTEFVARLSEFRRRLLALRVIAACGFTWLFIVGPAFTWLLGPVAAIYYTAAGVYLTIVVAVGFLWCRRRDFGLTAAHAAWLSAELLVCPPCLASVVRKVTVAVPFDVDGVQVALAAIAGEMKAGFVERLESRAQELIGNLDGGDDKTAGLVSYLAMVKGVK